MLTEAEYRALAEFRHALRIFLRFSEEAARREGLTPNQHQLLLAIRGFPEVHSPTITDLAELLQLQHHSVVELVDRAVDAHLVRRKVDREDRRRHRLTLTPKGSRILARLSESHRDELRRCRYQLSNIPARTRRSRSPVTGNCAPDQRSRVPERMTRRP